MRFEADYEESELEDLVERFFNLVPYSSDDPDKEFSLDFCTKEDKQQLKKEICEEMSINNEQLRQNLKRFRKSAFDSKGKSKHQEDPSFNNETLKNDVSKLRKVYDIPLPPNANSISSNSQKNEMNENQASDVLEQENVSYKAQNNIYIESSQELSTYSTSEPCLCSSPKPYSNYSVYPKNVFTPVKPFDTEFRLEQSPSTNAAVQNYSKDIFYNPYPPPRSSSITTSSDYDSSVETYNHVVPTKKVRHNSSYSAPSSNALGSSSIARDVRQRFVTSRRRQQILDFHSAEAFPLYKGCQLIGDSQLLRFSEQMLGHEVKKYITFTTDTNQRRLGYCVSGQKTGDLACRLLKMDYKIHHTVILLIGTNDITHNTCLRSMCEKYDVILNVLKKHAKNIILLTVPPVPRLENEESHWQRLERFNKFISDHDNGSNITVINIASLFITYNNRTSDKFFEPIFNNNVNRIDRIHLNRRAFRLIKCFLDIEYFDKDA